MQFHLLHHKTLQIALLFGTHLILKGLLELHLVPTTLPWSTELWFLSVGETGRVVLLETDTDFAVFESGVTINTKTSK